MFAASGKLGVSGFVINAPPWKSSSLYGHDEVSS